MRRPSDIAQIVSDRQDLRLIDFGDDGLACTLQTAARAGRPNVCLRIIASWGGGWDHVSVSTACGCPTWEEMVQVKQIFFRPDETCVQFHPADDKYVNTCGSCLHIWRQQGHEYELPPREMV